MTAKTPFAVSFGLVGCLAFGFAWRDIQHGQLPPVRALNTLFGVQSTGQDSPEQVFKQSYQRIQNSYIRPVKTEDLKYAGMEGLMSSLGDPHTVFFPPKDAQAFNDETHANFFGVGARLNPDPLGAKVMNVFQSGPAYAAGLRKGDMIIGVDGKSVSGRDIDQIVDRIKGPEGTVVRLTLVREDAKKPFDISIRRARIVAPTVDSQFFSDSGIGYLSITAFAEPTTDQFIDELDKLEHNPLKGLVIDLRGNPGGLLETAVNMLSLFVDDKVVVTMKFRAAPQEAPHTLSGHVHDFRYPITVLMNEDSASAAEIFAGVLHDYGKATLVGTHSYGKASVQNVFPMVDNSSAKITIAHYFLPQTPYFGRKVDSDGVFLSGGLEPDVKAELDWDHGDPVLGDPKKDSQLARAIQVLKEKQP
jgi:carboxyl-terminal processing protease